MADPALSCGMVFSGAPSYTRRLRLRRADSLPWHGWAKQLVELTVLVTAAVACGGASNRPVGTHTATTQRATPGNQHLDVTLTGGVTARITTAGSENSCSLLDGGTRLNCLLTTSEGETGPYLVFLNLLHFTGPGTYSAREQPAKGSEKITAGVSLLIRATLENFVPLGGSVVITKGNTKSGSLGVVAAGVINADVQPDAAGGAVTVPVHISGTFSTSLIGP
jgi:hypothetical protein